ncbi:hypothetical protein DENSPDRAFT_928667 [Dentipellis sp. KUC8613]|nr:hypothetical protein DENSPDRAFT_928667 [Dentipellis sp. KUC8613]
MEKTPKRLVHWALEYSNSSFASPISEASSSESVNSSSTLQYVNSQLVAHGFAQSPGLVLDGLSNSDSEKVVKCLMGMLSQRMEDMTRTEDLTTKYRTLTYDHERLVSLHRSATEKAANAERETNLQKSKLATATRALQQSEAAHKHTTNELQRTRTSLQALRSQHQAEIKKKEKDIERMTEKWSKLSDSQLKLGSVPSGMTIQCANADVLEGRPDAIFMGGRGLVDTALEEAEEACKQLREENKELKALIVDVANAVQKILHKATKEDPDDLDYPPPLSDLDLFALGPPDVTFDKLSTLLTSLRNAVAALRSTDDVAPRSSVLETPKSEDGRTRARTEDIEQLQKTITTLRSELDKAQKESSNYASQAQALFERVSADAQLHRSSSGTQAMSSRDAAQEQLDQRQSELEQEHAAISEAAVRLGKERADLEAERIKFLEEKRSWQVEMMLSERPPPPPDPVEPAPLPSSMPSPHRSPRKQKLKLSSPRKSPRKVSAGKRPRLGHNRSSSGGLKASTSKVVPSYETEVIPPLTGSLLPTTFVLPPPSPQSRFPPRSDALLAPPASTPDAIMQSKSEPALPREPQASGSSLPASKSETNLHAYAHPQPSTTPPYTDSSPDSSGEPPAQTPPRLPFPMAKPFVPRMIHAYSPAKPSPLSRILMLGDSPEGAALPAPTFEGALDAVNEDDEMLDAELLPPEEEPPLREKKLEKNVESAPVSKRRAPAGHEPGAKKSVDKGKGKASAPSAPSTRSRSAAGGEKGEKENTSKRPAKSSAARSSSTTAAAPAPAPAPAKTSVGAAASAAAKGKLGVKRKAPADGESAPASRGWRG